MVTQSTPYRLTPRHINLASAGAYAITYDDARFSCALRRMRSAADISASRGIRAINTKGDRQNDKLEKMNVEKSHEQHEIRTCVFGYREYRQVRENLVATLVDLHPLRVAHTTFVFSV